MQEDANYRLHAQVVKSQNESLILLKGLRLKVHNNKAKDDQSYIKMCIITLPCYELQEVLKVLQVLPYFYEL